MEFLDIAPLFSFVIGVLLILFILFKKSGLGKDRKMRYVLVAIISFYTFSALDSYLIIDSNGLTPYYGMSEMVNHLPGFLLYYFVLLFTKSEVNKKKWLLYIALYTIVRWFVFIPIFEYDSLVEFNEAEPVPWFKYVLVIEFYTTSSINIFLSILAYLKLKRTPSVLTFSPSQAVQYRWMKLIFIGFVVAEIAIFFNMQTTLLNLNNFAWNLKLDTLLIMLLFFAFTFSVMHFPVFAFSGDFEDLSNETKQKYEKSSLKDSHDLFLQIESYVKSEQLYLNSDLKLNLLSEKLGKSVHHISQAINQNADKNFPDYINDFRVEEAKKKLLEPKPDTIFAIALDVGFNSKAAFYAAFKKSLAQTPTEFRKANIDKR